MELAPHYHEKQHTFAGMFITIEELSIEDLACEQVHAYTCHEKHEDVLYMRKQEPLKGFVRKLDCVNYAVSDQVLKISVKVAVSDDITITVSLDVSLDVDSAVLKTENVTVDNECFKVVKLQITHQAQLRHFNGLLT
jgi:hypothetical protein